MRQFTAFAHEPPDCHPLLNPDSQTPVVRPVPEPAATGVFSGIRRFFTAARLLQQREKLRIRAEIAQVPGLMALLMKPRNGQKWSKADRAELREQMRRLSRLSLYLAACRT